MHSNRIYFLVYLSLLTCFTSVFAQSVSINVSDSLTDRCEGNIELTTVVTDMASTLTTPFSYEWSVTLDTTPSDLLNNVDGNPGQGTGIGNDFSSINISLNQPGDYVFAVTINGMPLVTNTTVPITVNAPPNISAGMGLGGASIFDQCINGISEINLFDYLESEDPGGEWVDQSTQTVVNGLIENPVIADSGRYTYTVTSNVAGPCNGFMDSTFIDLTLTEEIGVNLEPSLEILCAGESVNIASGLNVADYTFQWFFNDNALSGQTTPTLTGSFEDGTFYVEYTSVVPGSCTVRSSDALVVNIEAPIITDLSSGENSFSNTNTITVEFDEDLNGVYEFILDDGTPQSSNIFENVGPGSYEVTVNDISNEGGCGSDARRITIFGLPQFFTPNGDRINDTWNLQQDPSSATNVTIFVFDRFGKLLTQVFPGGSGWDGTFGGNNLPSDDYWYSLTDESTGEVITGHFTLIR